MEVRDPLKELDMTAEEMDRLTKALKDDKFREMLRDYAQEISEPENRRKYEAEIQLLEQERGNSIEFIHPQPFRAIRTSVDGKHKCFINICASDKVGKPESKCVVSEDGRRGQSWSLPHSLPPGRQDRDHKGNQILIYDVIFHPDTLHIASKNKRFMDMVEGTAIQGIQDAFKVSLDKNNVREMRRKYKGTPQPCVIRKPIPGYKAKVPSEQPDPLAFPYPDEKRPTTLPETKPKKNSSEPTSFLSRPQKEPTKPKYTVKYRSVIDLQDFRCSRDSAQSPRPREIVVTVDLPLLKSVADTSLEVKEKSLLLESKVPAYRLELPLAYPVDEDKGEAKFNKQRGQLTVTLPVLPSRLAFDYSAGHIESDGESQEEDGKKRELKKEEGRQTEEQEMMVEHVEEDEGRSQEEGEEQVREDGSEDEEDAGGEKERWKKMERKGLENVEEQIHNKEVGQEQNKQDEGGCDQAVEKKDPDVGDSRCDSSVEKQGLSVAVEGSMAASPETEKQNIFISAGRSCDIRETEEVNPASSLESTPKEESEKTTEAGQGSTQVGTDAATLDHSSGEESKSAAAAAASFTPSMATTTNQNNDEDFCSEIPAAEEARKSSRGDEDKQSTVCSEEDVDVDVDDLPTEQLFPVSDNKPPPVILREIDEDGKETVISDHSTSAGFVFQNTLLYELD
ncbi:protein kintoun [Stegastes partitus]|uniref:Protein kintoun n=1 Tax=Stegastes partitus TaxID=144197 RepID=A0A9Y4K061_9TELE|nr:PREDICTED: protein kintoun [Stegastes partitus]